MQLVEQLIREKIERSEEHFLNARNIKAIWDFYCAYQVSKIYVKFIDLNKYKRNYFWKNFVIHQRKNEGYSFLIKIHQKDFEVISKALKELDINIEQSSDDYNKLRDDSLGVIGVLSYEYPDQD